MKGTESIVVEGPEDEAARPALDLFGDAAFGLTLIGWAAVGLYKGRADTPVTLTLVAVNVVVGALFLLRRAPRRRASTMEVALCMPSVICGPLAMGVAPAPEAWPVAAQALFVASAAGLVVALVTLGSSFGILPAVREVVARGPYRLVRHPIYAAELLLVVAAAGLGARSLWGAAVIAATLATLVLRIVVEERVLAGDAAYGDYRERVRWRLLPLIW
jgi:protein-S-isoprenylcysteine O-methyltransferase Ste14